VFLFIISPSISVITIFSLVTSISRISPFLFIVNITFEPAGPLIHVITSLRELSTVISFWSTFVTISHHFNHALSDGEPGIGESILSIHGFSISTYEPIHSYSQDNESWKLSLSIGGK